MPHIFISYSKQDIEFTRYLRALLQEAGFSVWLDEAQLTPSTRWWKDIEQNITDCGAFMVIMSPHSQQSDWVEREILLAESNKKPIYPVLLAGNPWSRLANIQYEDMRTALHAKLSNRLLNSLQGSIEARPVNSIAFQIEEANILTTAADVIILKYAQDFRGADAEVAKVLAQDAGFDKYAFNLGPGEARLVDSKGALTAPQTLFLGTIDIRHFDYAVIREFAQQALATTAELAPDSRHIAMTIHGIRSGLKLDGDEVLRSQIAGYFDALQAGTYPPHLERLTIVEYNPDTTARLQVSAEKIFAELDTVAPYEIGWGYHLMLPDVDEPMAVMDSNVRPHAYVIMRDHAEMEDVFYFGIQQPTHAHGLLCEQAAAIFDDGETLEQAMQRIREASVVIAEMTHADETLYLQLGYAWGQQRPTILIARDAAAVNLRHPNCARYQSIKGLEHMLSDLLDNLREQGHL